MNILLIITLALVPNTLLQSLILMYI